MQCPIGLDIAVLAGIGVSIYRNEADAQRKFRDHSTEQEQTDVQSTCK